MLQPQATFQMNESDVQAGYATITIEPLEAGYGHTLGNALRRVMLTSIAGYAITHVKIDGVNHQFSTMEGLTEDVIDLILNLKQVRIKSELQHGGTATLKVKGASEVTAADIACEAGFEVVNKDLVIAHLDGKSGLNVELTIEYGLGYQLATDQSSGAAGVIPVDSLYSPVTKVAYSVESTRVGRRTDFDKLIMQVWTDSTIGPKEAVQRAASILIAQFQQISSPVVTQQPTQTEVVSPEQAEVLRLTVEELDLPTRIANALRKGGYETVGDLIVAEKAVVAKVKNLGEKSVEIVQKALVEKGVDFRA